MIQKCRHFASRDEMILGEVTDLRRRIRDLINELHKLIRAQRDDETFVKTEVHAIRPIAYRVINRAACLSDRSKLQTYDHLRGNEEFWREYNSTGPARPVFSNSKIPES